MKSQSLFKVVAATALASLATLASADTQNLNISATVSALCKFSSTVQTFTFGTVDPSTAGPIAGAGASVTYRCTKGTAATGVTAGNGNNFLTGSRRMGNGTDFIPYSLTVAGGTQTGTGFGAGQDKALTITGSIIATDYQNVSAGAYTDVVLLTITP